MSSTSTATTPSEGPAFIANDFFFTATGLALQDVREAAVIALAEAFDTTEQKVSATIGVPAGSGVARRMAATMAERAVLSRRLQTVWTVDFIVETVLSQEAAFQAILDSLQEDSATFATQLLEALVTVTGFSSDDLVFEFGGFGQPPPADSPDAVLAEVEFQTTLLVDNLLAGNDTRVELEILGVQAVAQRVTTESIVEAGGALPIAVDDGAEVSVPASVFDDLGVSGEVVFVVIPLKASQFANTTSETEVDIQSTLNLDLFNEEGGKYAVGGLSNPINLTLPMDSGVTAEAVCAFWDADLNDWSSVGVEVVSNEGGILICATVHLSLFGAIVRGLLATLLCANGGILSKEGFDALGASSDWVTQWPTVVFWIILLSFIVLITWGIVLDIKRYQTGRWSDEHFLVPDGAEAPEEAGVEAGAAAGAATAVICFAAGETIVAACEILGGVVRDMADEIFGMFFEWFGEVRDICEGICEGCGAIFSGGAGESLAGGAVAGGGLAGFCFVVARSAARTTAHRESTAAHGVVPDEDYKEALAVIEEKKVESNNPNSPRNQEPNSPQSPNSPNNQGNSRHATPRCEKREETLKRLHDSTSERFDNEHAKLAQATAAGPMLANQFIAHGPIGSVMLFSIYYPSSVRALLLCCDVLGATMVATIFMEVNSSMPNKKESDEDCEIEGIGEMIGRLIAIGLVSGMLAAFPVAVFSRLHHRKFLKMDYEGSKAWKRQLKKWRVMDIILWILALAYIGFATIYIMLFFANVAQEDQGAWVVSAGISFASDAVLVPIAVVGGPPLVATVMITVLCCLLKKSRSEVAELILSENRRVGNNPEGEAAPEAAMAGESSVDSRGLRDVSV